MRESIVRGKLTAFRVTVRADNLSVIPPSSVIAVELTFENITYTQTLSRDAFINQGTFASATVMFNSAPPILPLFSGIKQVTATVDPSNIIAESDEANNTNNSRIVEVKAVENIRVAYVPVFRTGNRTAFLSSAAETIEHGNEFLLDTFPFSRLTFSSVRTGEISASPDFSGCIQTSCPRTFAQNAALALNATSTWNDLMTLATIGFFNSADRTVGVVAPDYFSQHGLCGILGLTLAKQTSSTVLAAVGYWTVPAHEIGHTYGLPIVDDEEYDACPPISNGNPTSEGYRISRGQAIAAGSRVCLMGTAGLATSSSDPTDSRWIERADFEHLFRAVRVDPNDPRVVFVTGILHKDNRLELGHWALNAAGIADQSEGDDVTIRVLDLNDTVIQSLEMPLSFTVSLEGFGTIETDSTVFSRRIPLTAGAASLEFERNGVTVLKVNPLTTALRDAVALVPDVGFIVPATPRRLILTYVLKAMEHELDEHDVVDALQLLRAFKALVTTWIRPAYPLKGPAELTRRQVLDEVDVVAMQLQTLSH